MIKNALLLVEGRVQGVGFRYTTKQIADEIGIKGTVRNNEDGTVSIEAVGEAKQLENFIEKIKNNPTPFSKVDHVSIEEKESIENFISFHITN
ncbi:acylphosphatase [Jeotgalibaca sp. MA1X17-3]|uniref:acylphosphatase n=1 Tax=Jeotgalibaca sp. MA1X17-3 TaxID=2908211 RepID=UPI001F3D5008|nr:acylphosphatase [Jeotgalibaca sp. MA1X17-3]UJF14880.1 acylphosphatase [Jeotgalibaca sp. MA1X17-3]